MIYWIAEDPINNLLGRWCRVCVSCLCLQRHSYGEFPPFHRVDNKSFIRFGVVEYEDLFNLANNIRLGLRPRRILFSRLNKSSYSTPPYRINDQYSSHSASYLTGRWPIQAWMESM